MAPLISFTIRAVLGSLALQQQQSVLQTPPSASAPSLGTNEQYKQTVPGISAISWGLNRMDIFGRSTENGAVAHKFWSGSGWEPAADKFEELGTGFVGLFDAPASVSWGANRMDLFARDSTDGSLLHKYFDGRAWKPSPTSYEALGGGFNPDDTQLAAISWGPGRLDIFGIDASKASLSHKFYDGTAWQPTEGAENLGGGLAAGVSAVSWGPGRLDVVALGADGAVLHLYYDGSNWSNWEDLRAPEALGVPTIISWGKDRLDIFATSTDKDKHEGGLYHVAWDGTRWLDWELLGGGSGGDDGVTLTSPVAATSWSANRIDIVASDTHGNYWYKYWDGSSWRPAKGDDGSKDGLYQKGATFKSLPALVSWGPNRLDIYGVSNDSKLAHQTWYGSGWYPEWSFETLGDSWR